MLSTVHPFAFWWYLGGHALVKDDKLFSLRRNLYHWLPCATYLHRSQRLAMKSVLQIGFDVVSLQKFAPDMTVLQKTLMHNSFDRWHGQILR